MKNKAKKAYLYDEYDFVDELGEIELTDGQANMHDLQTTSSIDNDNNVEMVLRSKNSVASLIKETDQGVKYFFAINNDSPNNTEITYKENGTETKELEVMVKPNTFNGPAEYETWEPSNSNDILKGFEEDVSNIKENKNSKALGECLFIDAKDIKTMDKVLSKFNEDKREDTVNYSKEGFNSVTVQNLGDKIALFEENSEDPSLLKEFERKFNRELKKDIDGPSI